MFGILRRSIVTDLLNGRITVEDFYRRMYITAVFITVAIFALSLLADVGGINGLNIVLIPVWVLIVGYFGFHPTYILAALTVGGAASLGSDATRQRIIDGMKAAGGKWKQFFLHGAMFGGVFFLTRFLVPIREYPFAGMVMLGALITLGLWTWLYETGTVYKRYVLGLILVSLAVGVFGAFAGKPEKDGYPAAAMSGGVTGIVDDFFYSKTLDVEITDSQNSKVCGVRPGKRKFRVPYEVNVWVDGYKTDITSALRVNGTYPGEPFVVDGSECVTISFAVGEDFKGKGFPKKSIALAFE